MSRPFPHNGISHVVESGFAFDLVDERLWLVSKGRRNLGHIRSFKPSQCARYMFKLADDESESPRLYRGRVHAARALEELDKITKTAKAERWSAARLILEAWRCVPNATGE